MIDDLNLFLEISITLEREAAEGYERLTALMIERGDEQTAALFRELAGYSRMHMEDIEARANEITQGKASATEAFEWPDGFSPENPMARLPDAVFTPRLALELALEVEQHACDFYSVVAGQTRSEAVQELAQAFSEEEAEHAEYLERWLKRY